MSVDCIDIGIAQTNSGMCKSLHVVHTSNGCSTNHSGLLSRLRNHEFAGRCLDCPMIGIEMTLNLLKKEITSQGEASREDNQFRIQHTTEIHTAHAKCFGGNFHTLVGKDISRLCSIHNPFGRDVLLVAQNCFLVRMISKVLLGLENQAIGRSVLLIATLLTTSARSSIGLVDLEITHSITH